MEFDFSACPCEIHAVPIGECGCPPVFIDQEWLDRDSEERMRQFGAKMRLRHDRAREQAVLEILGDPDDTVLE